jgi:tetratricopeptide (TPR) repeat protein
MNDSASSPPGVDAAQLAVDAEHPWLGLASFTEETRAYFYGREEEIAELCRRVQRKLLTVLFGQSGLGKTSILRAGIVPRLRPEGYCPVYVRLDYSPESPAPSEQIKRAIFEATRASGQWTQTGVAESGESLWEFLHHRDDVLRDASGRTLIPLLIFDQFEEIFTLAQSDDFGRQRAAQFLDDLADLVENRAPKALEARMDRDEAAVERFDFTRGDYRILIALREDYLAHLEGLKGIMPSIAQNRMRLARMTGAQALSAVMKPGGRLVSEEVAGSIVRFIAGGAELANAEVEPALLSLICRELNNARIAQRRPEISADLLAGSRDTILSEFYERALADQPHGVRQVIEDNLLTESGYRESLAEERLQKALAVAGAPPGALAVLVNRRLLRIEERLDVRRVELTHDVLCSVVKASRDLRLEREARDAAERKLEAQRERERATRRALVRARQIAAACAVLAVGAAASAVFGYFGMKRAQEAELKAQETRAMAEQARGESEKLIVYLLDDFYLELEPVGRLDIVAGLAKRALDYYHELPPQLRTAETERNRALALVRYGAALRTQNKLDESDKALSEAIGVLQAMRKNGDQSEISAIGLATALTAKARVLDSQNDLGESGRVAALAPDVLAPLMQSASPSVPLRRAYGSVLLYQGYNQMRRSQEDDAVRTMEAAKGAYRSIDNLAVGDLAAAAAYTEASAWQVEALQSLGRVDDARRVGEEAALVAGQVLEKRPGHMPALRSRALISGNLSKTEQDSLNLRKALVLTQSAVRDWQNFLKIDPSNAIAWHNLIANSSDVSQILWKIKGDAEGFEAGRKVLELMRQRPPSAMSAGGAAFISGSMAMGEADLGNRRQAEADLADYRRYLDMATRSLPPDSFSRLAFANFAEFLSHAQLLADENWKVVHDLTEARLTHIEAMKPGDDGQKRTKNVLSLNAHREMALASYRLQAMATAQAEITAAVDLRKIVPPRTLDERRDAMDDQILRAMILAKMGRHTEAQEAIAPALKFHRELQARHHDDLTQRIQLAQALYAKAIAGGGSEAASLKEAAALIDGLPTMMRTLKSTSIIRGDIAEEQGARRK